MFGLSQDLINQAILGAATAAGGALITWALTRGSRALRNFGKTKLQVALEEQSKAMDKVKAAALTADTSDDKLAAAAKAVADRHVDNAKLVSSITDTVADAAPAAEHLLQDGAKIAIPKLAEVIEAAIKAKSD